MVTRRLFSLFRRRQDGSAITEFALIVPVFFLVVYAVLGFGRAYQRLNVLTGALREGARIGATLNPCNTGTVARDRAVSYAAAFGVSLNPASVLVACGGTVNGVNCANSACVYVTNYALFSDLPYFGLSSRTVTRTAVFRWELAP